MVSLTIKDTTFWFLLFCIPIIKIKNKQELNMQFTNIFFKENKIKNLSLFSILKQIVNNAFFEIIFFG